MQKPRRKLRRQATISLIEGLVILFALLWVIVHSNQVSTGRAISYTKSSGHILVQLAELPELAGSEMINEQEWVLYGDGTLVFRTDPGDNLWRAQLSPEAIQNILDVIINHNQFFTSSEEQYGNIIHGSDDNELLLTVDANGQHKEVNLASEPTTKDAIDSQTTHMFAIEKFLLSYHPLHALYDATNYDPDGEGGN